MPPILFARSAVLSSSGAALALSSIPQNAQFLMFHIAARLDAVATDDLALQLQINASSGADYDGNTTRGTTGSLSTGVGGDGLNQTAWKVAELTNTAAPAGIFTEIWGLIPRYAAAEFHTAMWMGHTVDGGAVGDFSRHLGAGINDSVNAAITSLNIAADGGNTFAAGTKITIWGLGDAGSITPTSIARSAQSGLAIDFLGDEFKDHAATVGANNFTASNVTLGRVISLKITGGDGSTTIGFPAGTDVIENNYVAGADAWLLIRCTNEVGPAFTATLKDIV